MILKNGQNILRFWTKIISKVMLYQNLVQQEDLSDWILQNKHGDNNLRGCILEVDLEYPKDSHKLRKHYPLPPDKLEI